MKKFKRYLVTSALPYANGPLHIGHIAGAYLPADIYVRYLRLRGEDVVFICGSDEHGVPVTLRARKEGTSPQKVVDKYHTLIKETFRRFDISFDIYHRTSSKLHHETAADFFIRMNEKGEFIRMESEQFYDENQNQFLADRYITGTCPKCGYESAYGDQCEKCGSSLSPRELINPRSALSGNQPVLRKTSHWYLPLDRYQKEWLQKWVESHREDWKPSVYGQCKSWLDGGLQPRAVTRDLDWGVPVPLEEAQGKVLYVWFDAPIGYISATKAWAQGAGKDWKLYWQDDDTRLVHFIGKDNIVFHCIIFPAMLKAHGDYILPDNVPANEFLNLEGDKLSTSRNRAVWLHEYLDEFGGKEDVLRYMLCANMPEAKDNDFSWKDFQSRNNNELVAVLGNFFNRVSVLDHKFFEGKIPEAGKADAAAEQLRKEVEAAAGEISSSLETFRFRNGLSALMNIARAGNQYLAQTEPWGMEKGDPALAAVIYRSLWVCGELVRYMQIFLPFTAVKAAALLGLDRLPGWKGELIIEGNRIGEPQLLFEKIEDDVIEKQIAGLKQTAANKTESKYKPMIAFEDFTKLDLRTGTIKESVRVEGADKLLKLTVDLGGELRTVVSGIAEYYKPEETVGRQVSMLVNLQPRKIRGIESEGMVLLAEGKDGRLSFISPAESVEDGSVIR